MISARRASIANQPLSIRKDWESGRLTLAEQRAYIERVLALPGVRAWITDALAENDFVAFDEPYRTER